MTNTLAWVLDARLPSGHKLFRLDGPTAPEEVAGRFAIADQSGATPSTTEDGVLWVDRNRDIVLITNDTPRRDVVVLLPLLQPDGDETATVIDMPTALYLSVRFGMRIRDTARALTYLATKLDR